MSCVCPYCSKPAELVGGDRIYPHRSDLARLKFWACFGCGAWVGCHKEGKGPAPQDGTVPLGRLADAKLRAAKSLAHSAFDPLWQPPRAQMTRRGAYAWLAGALNIPVERCHIGEFDIEQCMAVVTAVEERNKAWQKKRSPS